MQIQKDRKVHSEIKIQKFDYHPTFKYRSTEKYF